MLEIMGGKWLWIILLFQWNKTMLHAREPAQMANARPVFGIWWVYIGYHHSDSEGKTCYCTTDMCMLIYYGKCSSSYLGTMGNAVVHI